MYVHTQEENLKNKRIASSDASLPKDDRRSRGLQEEPESGTVLGTTLRSMQQLMRWISWAASLCLPLPVDKKKICGVLCSLGSFSLNHARFQSDMHLSSSTESMALLDRRN